MLENESDIVGGFWQDDRRNRTRVHMLELKFGHVFSQRVMKPLGHESTMAPVGMVQWGPFPAEQYGLGHDRAAHGLVKHCGTRELVQLNPDLQRIESAEMLV